MSGKEEIISDDAYNGHDQDGIISRAVQYLFHQVGTQYSLGQAAAVCGRLTRSTSIHAQQRVDSSRATTRSNVLLDGGFGSLRVQVACRLQS